MLILWVLGAGDARHLAEHLLDPGRLWLVVVLTAPADAKDPQRRRPDGSAAWRASLQVNAPAARRLRYWTMPDSAIELSGIVVHDDLST